MAIGDYVIPSKTWRYICARMGMSGTKIRNLSGLTNSQRLYAHAVNLDNFIFNHLRVHLADLVREAEEVYELVDFRAICQYKGKMRFCEYLYTRKHRIIPAARLHKHYLYIFFYHWDIWTYYKKPHRADMMRTHPLRVWRVKNKMTYAMAADLFGVDPFNYLKMEAGRYWNVDPARYEQLGINYFSCRQWLKRWKVV